MRTRRIRHSTNVGTRMKPVRAPHVQYRLQLQGAPVSALWIACFILTYTFPILERGIGMGNTFWMYAGICALGFVFIYLRVPETKGKSLEQIEAEL